MMRQMFAAKQAALLKQFWLNCFFDLSLRHQIQKLQFVNVPIAFVFLVSVEHFLSGRRVRQMDVVDACNFLEEINRVVLF